LLKVSEKGRILVITLGGQKMKRAFLYCGVVISLLTWSLQKTQAEILFSDSFDTDTTANYTKFYVGSMGMSYAAAEHALRFSGNEQSFWYANSLSGVYDGSVSASVKIETLGTPDHGGTGNGCGVCIGLRVDPTSPVWGSWGVWGGLLTIWGTRYAIISTVDGAPSVNAMSTPYYYNEGQTYNLKLEVSGTHATLYINGSKVLETDGVTQPSSGTGTTGIWATDGDSGSTPSSFLVDNWQVTSGTTTPPANEVFFDDFKYDALPSGELTLKGKSDFNKQGWSIRTEKGGPGNSNASWSTENVLFQNGEDGHGIVHLFASTNGNPNNTTQSEILTPYKFFEGTYAARVFFTDEARKNLDGPIQAFYSISDWETTHGSNDYSECDFEYLANDYWSFPVPVGNPKLYVTTYESPAVKTFTTQDGSLAGEWHTLVFTVKSEEVKYCLDGTPLATHSGIFYPESNMGISFNHWFDIYYNILSYIRTYAFAVDWVLHIKDQALSPNQVESLVQKYRDQGTKRIISAKIFALSPVEISVTDPLGRTTNSKQADIPESSYILLDQNGDGDVDPTVILGVPSDGIYSIKVIPLPYAEPNDIYSLYVVSWFGESILVNSEPISDIPAEGFQVDVKAIAAPNNVPVANAGPDQTVYAWIDGIADVNLDGSGSYDDDNDTLTYKWSWTIDGNDYEANGVKPTIELPVGTHVISLIVNDGIVDSEPNEVVETIVPPIQANLWVVPKVLNCKSFLPKIMTTILLPKGITKDQIDTQQPLLLYPGAIKADWKWIGRDFDYKCRAWSTTIFAWFDKDELMSAIDGNGKVELAVVGQLKTGQYFFGTDDVSVICPGHWPWHRHWFDYPSTSSGLNSRWNRWCRRPF
jgi:hypothetical protein